MLPLKGEAQQAVAAGGTATTIVAIELGLVATTVKEFKDISLPSRLHRLTEAIRSMPLVRWRHLGCVTTSRYCPGWRSYTSVALKALTARLTVMMLTYWVLYTS